MPFTSHISGVGGKWTWELRRTSTEGARMGSHLASWHPLQVAQPYQSVLLRALRNQLPTLLDRRETCPSPTHNLTSLQPAPCPPTTTASLQTLFLTIMTPAQSSAVPSETENPVSPTPPHVRKASCHLQVRKGHFQFKNFQWLHTVQRIHFKL